jgi:hypothetical protein
VATTDGEQRAGECQENDGDREEDDDDEGAGGHHRDGEEDGREAAGEGELVEHLERGEIRPAGHARRPPVRRPVPGGSAEPQPARGAGTQPHEQGSES